MTPSAYLDDTTHIGLLGRSYLIVLYTKLPRQAAMSDLRQMDARGNTT